MWYYETNRKKVERLPKERIIGEVFSETLSGTAIQKLSWQKRRSENTWDLVGLCVGKAHWVVIKV